jgi:predicted MPP superfamily phosphohydrolase
MHPWIETLKELKKHEYGKFSVLSNHDYGEYVTYNGTR